MFDKIIGGIASGVVGGLFSQSGQESSNSANAAEAQMTRDYQERLSGTAHQREVKDLIAAGINPMLSAKLGGASTPTGATARYENTKADLGKNIAASGSSAAQFAATDNLEAQTVKARAESDLATAQAAETRARTPIHESQIEVNRATVSKINAELPHIASQIGLNNAQVDKIRSEIPNIISSNGLISAQTRQALAHAGLSNAQIAEVGPRIRQMLSAAGHSDALSHNERLDIPMHEARSAGADALNVPKIWSNAKDADTAQGPLWNVYDFLHYPYKDKILKFGNQYKRSYK